MEAALFLRPRYTASRSSRVIFDLIWRKRVQRKVGEMTQRTRWWQSVIVLVLSAGACAAADDLVARKLPDDGYSALVFVEGEVGKGTLYVAHFVDGKPQRQEIMSSKSMQVDRLDNALFLVHADDGAVSGKVAMPPSEDPSKLAISLLVSYEAPIPLRGDRKRVEFQADEPFEIDGLLPGTHKLIPTAYREDDDGRTAVPEIKTEPEQIVVEITAKEHHRQDITITEFKKRGG